MADDSSGNMPDEFDRLLGQLDGLPGVSQTRPVIHQDTDILGASKTFIVQTVRQQDRTTVTDDDSTEREVAGPPHFTLFLQVYTKAERIRVALPHKVCELIDRQRGRLTQQAVSRAAKRAAATRKARGIVPHFKTRKKKR